jgi:hypothetical protein
MQERAKIEYASPDAKATEHFGNEQENQDLPPFLFHISLLILYQGALLVLFTFLVVSMPQVEKLNNSREETSLKSTTLERICL